MNRNILLYKLYSYGMRGVTYKWLISYLQVSNRQRYCIVNRIRFDVLRIKYCVP